MENLFDFEGCSVNFTTSADLNDELITSLTSFALLLDQHRDLLQRTSESFTLPAAENETARVVSTVFGGVFGAACGGVCGVVGGTLGAVTAVTCARFCGKINAVGATVGFAGGVLGGAVGGTCSGGVGGAVGAAAGASGRPLPAAVGDVAWFSVGLATGAAIGGVFGGEVGAVGGAVGGALGAFCGPKFAVALVGIFGYFHESKDSKEKEEDVIQKTREEFGEMIKPLVDELKTIKSISDKTASDHLVHRVAAQTTRTLASVAAMEETISHAESGEEAERQSQKIIEELKTTSAEVLKVLVSLRKQRP